MKLSLSMLVSAAIVGVVHAQVSTNARALPSGATDASSSVSNLPNFMVTMQEGGNVPSEAKSTCDNRAAGSFKSSVGLTLEHYFAGGKEGFDQKVAALRPFGIKQVIQEEYDQADSTPGFVRKTAVVLETVDGAEAGYFSVTVGCVENANPTSTKTSYHARYVHDTTWADITVEMYAAGVDPVRKHAQEMIGKVKALNYASLK